MFDTLKDLCREAFRCRDPLAITILLIIVFIFLFTSSMIVLGTVNAFHTEPGKFTVVSKESTKDGKFLVFTDVTTYQVDDTIVFWRWDSSDVYGKLVVGKEYSATLQGYRIPILSMYPNLLDIKEVSPKVESK